MSQAITALRAAQARLRKPELSEPTITGRFYNAVVVDIRNTAPMLSNNERATLMKDAAALVAIGRVERLPARHARGSRKPNNGGVVSWAGTGAAYLVGIKE